MAVILPEIIIKIQVFLPVIFFFKQVKLPARKKIRGDKFFSD